MSSSIDIWTIIITFFVGVAANHVLIFLKYLYGYFWFHHKLLGEWNHYFSNSDGSEVSFRCDKFVIKKGMSHRLIFESSPQNHTGDKYKGYIIDEGNFFVVISKSKMANERVYQRFRIHPTGQKNKYMISLALALDYNARCSANVSILTKSKLSEKKFLEIINQFVTQDNANRITTILNYDQV